MKKRNLKFMTAMVLASSLMLSTSIGYMASAKSVSDNAGIVANQRSMSKYKFIDVKVTKDLGKVHIRGSLPVEIDQASNMLNILKANSELLGIENFDTMKFKEEGQGIYSISNFYQVVDGYKVLTNSIFFQPGFGPERDNDKVTGATIIVNFDNDIFNNLKVTKNKENVSLKKAINIAKEKCNDYESKVDSEVVIVKHQDKYYKTYKIEIGQEGFLIDVTNGNVIENYPVYIGPQ